GNATLFGAKLPHGKTKALFLATVMPDGSINSTGATITVSPNPALVKNGLTRAFAASGKYIDGSALTPLKNVTWSSANVGVATVTAAGVAKGVVPNNPYNATNFPKAATIKATVGNVSGSASLSVGLPDVASVAVSPSAASILADGTQQFSATGTFSDGSTGPLGSVTWSSSLTAVATVDGTGLATGEAQGATTITASSGAVSGNATLTVADLLVTSSGSLFGGGVTGVVFDPYLPLTVSDGGTPPFVWTMADGFLPPGLYLD